MTQQSVVHSTFTIERDYPASPSRIFAAFADPATKRRWFADPRSEVTEFTMDFRVGGRETTRFVLQGGPEGAPAKGTEIRNETTYHDIVTDRRIVLAYTMAIADRRVSASLATFELRPSPLGAKLLFTEQGAFFEGADGPKGRERGWRELLSQLDGELRKSA
jgi:uncharacterized protein YndB with AHSA1/START domain